MIWAIYKRVSTDEQEESGTSLDSQEERCRAHLVKRGFSGEVRVYSDTWSGAQLRERPALAELRKAVRHGELQGVLCYATDRLSRGGQAHLFILIEEFREHGVTLEFVTEQFEDSATGRFLHSTLAFVAEVEREKIRERTVRGKEQRIKSGRSMHGKRMPYGYSLAEDGETMAPHPEQAPIVRRIFREYESGDSLRTIGARLDAEGVPTQRAGLNWQPSTVRYILQNPLYAGMPVANRWKAQKTASGKKRMVRRDEEEHVSLPAAIAQPLVAPATFHAIQARLVTNKSWKQAGALHQEGLLRGGLVRCAPCDAPMSFVYRDKNLSYYRCQKEVRTGRGCGRSMALRDLDPHVWAAARLTLTRPELVLAQLEQQRENSDVGEELDSLRQRLATAEKHLRIIATSLAKAEDEIVVETLAGQLKAFTAQRKQLLFEIERVEEQDACCDPDAVRMTLEAWCERVGANADDLSLDEKRAALRLLGVAVTVNPRGSEPPFVISEEITVSRSSKESQRSYTIRVTFSPADVTRLIAEPSLRASHISRILRP